MDVSTMLESSPRTLRVGEGEPAASYELSEDMIAVRTQGSGQTAAHIMGGEAIAVEQLATASRAGLEERVVGPVYRQIPSGRLAMPTGRVFVRFAEGDAARAHEHELTASGYQLEEVPAYAPHSAWVRAATGAIADSLHHLDRLKQIPRVENVEPQLITEVARRG
jgi:hypothetical protein